ncbi:hypothetical protein Sjap_006122 [Stephania japonica]|uniref:Uncharacterized protein n=1 Tax=Stephania japonica TaxID=461633 RepID=A0AAP0K6V4_9MAGN
MLISHFPLFLEIVVFVCLFGSHKEEGTKRGISLYHKMMRTLGKVKCLAKKLYYLIEFDPYSRPHLI